MSEINISNYKLDFPFDPNADENSEYDSDVVDFNDFEDGWRALRNWELKKHKSFKFKIWHFKGIPMPNWNDIETIMTDNECNSCGDGRDMIGAIESSISNSIESLQFELEQQQEIEKLKKEVKRLKKQIKNQDST